MDDAEAHRSRHVRGAIVLTLALALTIVSTSAAGAAGRPVDVHGGWIGELPCVITAAGPVPPGSTSLSFSCVSGTTWDGDWTGHTHYVVTGTTDLATGNDQGTIDETFTGIDTASRAPGTLHLVGTLRVDGATNVIIVTERIVDGTGVFAPARGQAIFEGTQVSGVVGHGGYHARLSA